MFSSSIRSALIALALFAVAEANQSISLKLDAPTSVDGVENLKVDAIITNTGSEAVTLLKDPRGALSSAPTNTFKIADSKGAIPAFDGILVKYVPKTVVAANDAKDFATLAPGESLTVTHDLSRAYNFSASGEGSYEIEANNLFYVVDQTTKAITPLYANLASSVSSKVSGKLAVARREENSLERRASFVGCTAARQTLINAATSNALTYANGALSYLNSNTAATTRYTTWFGAFTSARRTTVIGNYQRMINVGFSGKTYDCTCTDSAYAYVYPTQYATIYLCNAFWSAPATGTDSKAGTLVHEMSHFTNVGSTQDYAYGQSAAKSLASSNPANAVRNADNHEYFAENTPSLP